MDLEIYTDGSSLGNPGDGGWGVIFLGRKNVVELGGKVVDVTNNQMELLAIKKAFEYIAEKDIKGYQIIVKSDSKYFINGIEKWVLNWVKNNWKTAAKKTVKNQELWKEIITLRDFVIIDNKIEYKHVKAHNGEIYNERVDDIARFSAEGRITELFKGKRVDYI